MIVHISERNTSALKVISFAKELPNTQEDFKFLKEPIEKQVQCPLHSGLALSMSEGFRKQDKRALAGTKVVCSIFSLFVVLTLFVFVYRLIQTFQLCT
jgi:hypothetical protein